MAATCVCGAARDARARHSRSTGFLPHRSQRDSVRCLCARHALPSGTAACQSSSRSCSPRPVRISQNGMNAGHMAIAACVRGCGGDTGMATRMATRTAAVVPRRTLRWPTGDRSGGQSGLCAGGEDACAAQPPWHHQMLRLRPRPPPDACARALLVGLQRALVFARKALASAPPVPPPPPSLSAVCSCSALALRLRAALMRMWGDV